MQSLYGSSKSAFSGFLFGFTIYCSVFFGLYFYLNSEMIEIKRFTASKDNFLDMTFVERDSQKPALVVSAPVAPPQEIVKTPAQEIVTPQPKAVEQTKTDIRGLFSNVNMQVKEVAVEQPKTTARIAQKSEPQTSKATNTVQNLNLESVSTRPTQDVGGGSVRGEYDPYLGPISDILLQNWQLTIETESGLNGAADITFDRNGKMVNYAITKLSYNNAFNAKLRAFLERMKSFNFPRYDEEGLRTFNFTFKDEYKEL